FLVDLDRPIEVLKRSIVIAPAAVGKSAFQIIIFIIWVKFDRLTEVLERTVVVLLSQVSQAKLQICPCILRIELNGLIKILDRLVEIPICELRLPLHYVVERAKVKDNASSAVGLSIFRVDIDCVFEIFDGAAIVALPPIC